jgi:acyl dehydratase
LSSQYPQKGPVQEKRKKEKSMQTRYFEDFNVGDTLDLGSQRVTEEEIIAFARQFDPQPFHIDPELAKNSIFGGLVASGWHTIAIFMRLFVDQLLNKTVSMGSPGVEEVRWLKPVRPGDELYARFTVLACIPSKSRADLGIIRSKCEMFNQAGEMIMSLAGTHFLGRKPRTQT